MERVIFQTAFYCEDFPICILNIIWTDSERFNTIRLAPDKFHAKTSSRIFHKLWVNSEPSRDKNLRKHIDHLRLDVVIAIKDFDDALVICYILEKDLSFF